MKIIVGVLVALVGMACGLTYVGFRFAADPPSSFRTEKVVKRRLAFDDQRPRHAGAGAGRQRRRPGDRQDHEFRQGRPIPTIPRKEVSVDFGSMVHKGDVLA